MKHISRKNRVRDIGKFHYRIFISCENNRKSIIFPKSERDFFSNRTFKTGDEIYIGEYSVVVNRIVYRPDIDVTNIYVYVNRKLGHTDYIVFPIDLFENVMKFNWNKAKSDDENYHDIYEFLKRRGVLYNEDFDFIKELLIHYKINM